MSSHFPNHHPHSGSYSLYTASASPYHESSSPADIQSSLDIPGVRNQSREECRHFSRPQHPTSVRQDPDSTGRFASAHRPTPGPLFSSERSIHNRSPSNGGGLAEYSEWVSMGGTGIDHYSTSPSATTSTVSPNSVVSPSLPHGFHAFSREEHNIVLPQPPIQTLQDELYPSSPSSFSSIVLSPSPVDQFTPSADTTPDTDQSATYSFVALPPGTHAKKRPRRRHDEIERIYPCTFQNCIKAYGTLNHLNAHVNMQKHGPKRDPTEFKELRKYLKAMKDKKDGNALNAQSTFVASNAPSSSSTPSISESSVPRPQLPSDGSDPGLLRGIKTSPDSGMLPGAEVGISRSGVSAGPGVSVRKRRPELHRLLIPSLPPTIAQPQTASHEWRPSFHTPPATDDGPYSAPANSTRHPWPGRDFSGPASSISSYSSDENRDDGALSPGMYLASSDVNHLMQSTSIYDRYGLPSPRSTNDGTSMGSGGEGNISSPLPHQLQSRSYSMNMESSSSYHRHSLPPPPMQHQQQQQVKRESPEALYPLRLPLHHQPGAGFATRSHSGDADSLSYTSSTSDCTAGIRKASSSPPFDYRDGQQQHPYLYQNFRGTTGNSEAYSSRRQPGDSPAFRHPQSQQGAVAESHIYSNSQASGFGGGRHHDHDVHRSYHHPLLMPSPESRSVEMTDDRSRHPLPLPGHSSSNTLFGPMPMPLPLPLHGPMDPNSTLLTPLNSGHPNSGPRSLFPSPGSSSRHS